MNTDRLIKGLTVKQWWTIFSIPILVGAYSVIMAVLCKDIVIGGIIALLLFVILMCTGLYVSAAKNVYYECRGEKMSFKDLENEVKRLKEKVESGKE